jgi:hypothetical protein
LLRVSPVQIHVTTASFPRLKTPVSSNATSLRKASTLNHRQRGAVPSGHSCRKNRSGGCSRERSWPN